MEILRKGTISTPGNQVKLWYFTQWELLAETFPNLQGLGNVKIEMTNRVGDPKLSMKCTIVVTLASYKNK